MSRTDNDIMKIPKKEECRYAGIERGISFLLNCCEYDKTSEKEVESLKSKLRFRGDKTNIPEESKSAAEKIAVILEKYNILIAKEGLEEDIYNSPIQNELKEFYGSELSAKEIIDKMKDHKAINMYEFLKKKKTCLLALKDDALALPLIKAKNYIEEHYGAY